MEVIKNINLKNTFTWKTNNMNNINKNVMTNKNPASQCKPISTAHNINKKQ